MAPPTKDEDERAPGQAAADRVRERHSRALDRYDLETERALDAYEDNDRESITLVNHITVEDARRAQGRVDTPANSLPAAAPSGVKQVGWALFRSLPRDTRNKVVAAVIIIAAVTFAILVVRGDVATVLRGAGALFVP